MSVLRQQHLPDPPQYLFYLTQDEAGTSKSQPHGQAYGTSKIHPSFRTVTGPWLIRSYSLCSSLEVGNFIELPRDELEERWHTKLDDMPGEVEGKVRADAGECIADILRLLYISISLLDSGQVWGALTSSPSV